GFDVALADSVVMGGPHLRVLRMLPKALGVVDMAMSRAVDNAIGNTGTAHAWLLLAGALEDSAPGQTIVAFSVADGVDAFVLRTTNAIDAWRAAVAPATTAQRYVETGGQRVSYPAFLTWRGHLRRDPPRRPDPTPPSPPASARSTAWK